MYFSYYFTKTFYCESNQCNFLGNFKQKLHFAGETAEQAQAVDTRHSGLRQAAVAAWIGAIRGPAKDRRYREEDGSCFRSKGNHAD